MKEKLTQGELEQWMSQTGGRWLFVKDICAGMQIDPQGSNIGTLYTALHRLAEKGILKHHPTIFGKYRFVDIETEKMDLVRANPKNVLSIKWPFELEKYVKIFRKNVIVIFGSKDAGKTAFVLNLMKLNLGKFPIRYLNSDMGEEELRMRLEKFPDVTIEQWQEYVDFYERNDAFADMIDPNAMNIVDFLEMHQDFYAIGQPIKEMASKLNNGILVPVIQKNPGVELPLGKGRALEKAKMALDLDPGKITLRVAKNWQNGITSSPKGKAWKYKLIGGAKIVQVQEWQGG